VLQAQQLAQEVDAARHPAVASLVQTTPGASLAQTTDVQIADADDDPDGLYD